MEKQEQSHPSRMRGLKLKQEENQILTGHVASLVDAWIKIKIMQMIKYHLPSRIPRGCVD